MTLKRLALLFCVFLFAFSATPLHAQMTGDIAEGLTPYESFHGGDIDSVNLSNGNLVLSFPLVSYPQRGALKFSFSFVFNGKSTRTNELCTPVPPVNCSYYWTYAGPTVVEDNSVSVVETLFQPSGANSNKLSDFAVVTSDGGQHPLVRSSGGGQITGDATGFWANSAYNTGVPAPTVIISRNGVRNFITGSVLREDANGNQILIGASDYTDTMGRQVSAIGSSVPGTSSSTAACPSGPLPVASATTWTVPGEGGGTMQFMFCQVEAPINIPAQGKAPAVTGGTSLVTQSIVLPNSTVWTFAYDSYGLINQVTFPTGGTIAYTYTSGPLGGCNYQNNISRSVATRTVNANDGTGAHTWQYTSALPTVKVTDPLANDTVHTFALFGTAGGCYNFETLTQYYQGSSTGGTLLKTAKTDWNNFANGNNVYTNPGMVPIRVTTTGTGMAMIGIFDLATTFQESQLQSP
jgi:YD repeat-containing protein